MAVLAINTYDIGDSIRCTITFATIAGVPTDPTTVTFIYRNPSGTETTWVYPPAGGDIVRDDTGDYHADVPIDDDGLWYYRWTGTGALIAGADHGFYVRKSEIA